MTGRDLITASLRLIGVLAPGESLEASEATDGLASLNRMVSSWSTERLLVFANVREEFTLTPGVQTYSIGVGATFNTARPQQIEAAGIEVQSAPTAEHPVKILTMREWAKITDKETQASIPTGVYPEGTYPNETLNVYPVPAEAHKLVIYSWKPLTAIYTLDTAVSFPPGYEEALIYNHALRLAPEYGRMVPDAVALVAQESKANLKRMNQGPRYLRSDTALLGRSRAFDIYKGDSA